MITDARFIPGTAGAYALSHSGTLSRFHATPNPFAAPVIWNDTDLDSLYTRIVPELNGLNVYIIGESFDAADLSIWSPAAGGVITDVTATTIREASVFAGSSFVADLRTANPSICGKLVSIQAYKTSDDTPVTLGPFEQFIIDCGVEQTEDNLRTLFSLPFCIDYTAVRLSFDFYVIYTFEIDPDCGGGTGDAVITQYSTDSGATFEPIKIVGVMPSVGYVGADVIKIGTTALAGAGSQVFRTNSGGVWDIYSGTLPSGAQPNALFVPRYQFGGTISSNINTSSPQYLMGSGTLSAAGETLWKVTSAGSLFTPISPKIGTLAGEIVSPDALAMPWNSGSTIAAIARFTDGVKFCVSVNTGATWHFTDLNDGAREVVTRRSDIQVKQAIVSNSGAGGYIPNYKGTIVTDYDRFFPGSTMYSIDVFG